MTLNIWLLMEVVIERQGWQRQRCSRNAACVDNTHKWDTGAPSHTHALLRDTHDVWHYSTVQPFKHNTTQSCLLLKYLIKLKSFSNLLWNWHTESDKGVYKQSQNLDSGCMITSQSDSLIWSMRACPVALDGLICIKVMFLKIPV